VCLFHLVAILETVLTKETDKPILVPLTNSLYVPGKLSDAEHVLVDVGTGYFVKKVRVNPHRPISRSHLSPTDAAAGDQVLPRKGRSVEE
jgi:hypothetical protein